MNRNNQQKSIRQALDEIAKRVQMERDNKSVRNYGYEEKDGYFTANLTPRAVRVRDPRR